jgi:hypothetical protein
MLAGNGPRKLPNFNCGSFSLQNLYNLLLSNMLRHVAAIKIAGNLKIRTPKNSLLQEYI